MIRNCWSMLWSWIRTNTVQSGGLCSEATISLVTIPHQLRSCGRPIQLVDSRKSQMDVSRSMMMMADWKLLIGLQSYCSKWLQRICCPTALQWGTPAIPGTIIARMALPNWLPVGETEDPEVGRGAMTSLWQSSLVENPYGTFHIGCFCHYQSLPCAFGGSYVPAPKINLCCPLTIHQKMW